MESEGLDHVELQVGMSQLRRNVRQDVRDMRTEWQQHPGSLECHQYRGDIESCEI